MGAIACISRWFSGSASSPTVSDTRAASGTADTPALPMSGLILWPSLQKRFISLTKSTPQVVAMTNESSPRPKIFSERGLRKTSAWVDAPTVSPMRVVITSMSGPLAVLARRLVTPDSFRRLPKKSMPSRGRPLGTMNAVQMNPTTGNMIFSRWLTLRGAGMRIRRSFLLVSSSIMGFWITGTSAM